MKFFSFYNTAKQDKTILLLKFQKQLLINPSAFSRLPIFEAAWRGWVYCLLDHKVQNITFIIWVFIGVEMKI